MQSRHHEFGTGFEMIVCVVPLNSAPVIDPAGVPVTKTSPTVPLNSAPVIEPDGVPVTETLPELPLNAASVMLPCGVPVTSIVADMPVNVGYDDEYDGTLDTAVMFYVYVEVNVGSVPAPHDIDNVSPSSPPTVIPNAGSVP